MHKIQVLRPKPMEGYFWMPLQTMSDCRQPFITSSMLEDPPTFTEQRTIEKMDQTRGLEFNDCFHSYITGSIMPKYRITDRSRTVRLRTSYPDNTLVYKTFVVIAEWDTGAQLLAYAPDSDLITGQVYFYASRDLEGDTRWLREGTLSPYFLYDRFSHTFYVSGYQMGVAALDHFNDHIDYSCDLYTASSSSRDDYKTWYSEYFRYERTEDNRILVRRYADAQKELPAGEHPGFNIRLGALVHVGYSYDMDAATDLLHALGSYHRDFSSIFQMPERKPFQDLVIDLINSIAYLDLNMIAFTSDLRELKSLIKSCADLLQAVTSKKINLKTLSSAYLLKKYAIDTSVDDVKTLINTVSRLVSSREYRLLSGIRRYHERRGSTTTIKSGKWFPTFSRTQHVRVSHCVTGYLTVLPPENGAVRDFLTALDLFDASPTLENLWDLVPYSFVIDWFIDFGSNLEALAAYRKASQYRLKALIWSRKYEINLEFAETSAICGNLKYVNYQREVFHDWPYFMFSLNFSLPLHHLLEGGALLIQKM